MNLLSELEWRGLVYEVSDRDFLNSLTPEHSFYVGYDPTAPSLQIGNLVPIIVSLHLARAGLRAIQLFGGATGSIGDPSGRSSERPLLDREAIDRNVAFHSRKVQEIFERVGVKVEFVNNYEWTKNVSVLDFLREVGKHFPINYMLGKEVVKSRLDGEGLTYTEFSYMLLQAYDFYQLWQGKNCRLQIGGSDQWGNITAGLELIRRKLQQPACVLAFPLITDSQGRKFSKSSGGTLWLSADYTSPYRFHQHWLNVEDADVIRYLKVFTFHGKETIAAMESTHAQAPEKREAQKLLADSICNLVHGPEATKNAKRSAEVLFGGPIAGLNEATLAEIFSDVPSSSFPRSALLGLPVVDIMVKTGLVKSKGEARRLVSSGGAYLNNERLSDTEAKLEGGWFDSSRLIVLRAGKKSYHLLKIADE